MKCIASVFFGATVLCQSICQAESVLASSASAQVPSSPALTAGGLAATALSPVSALFSIGTSRFKPHAIYRFLQGDDIQARPGQKKFSTIEYISAGVDVDIGTHWHVDYAPSWVFYSNEAFQDSVEHVANLAGNYSIGDWSLRLSQNYTNTSQPLIETGAQTKEERFSTDFLAVYHFSDKATLDTGLNWTLRLPEGFAETREWGSSHALRFRLTSGINAGLTVSFRRTELGTDSRINSVRPGIQIGWRPRDRLTVDLSGGFEVQKGQSGSTDSITSPVVGFSVIYRPIAPTTLSVSYNHELIPSYFEHLLTESDSASVAIEQRFLRHFTISPSWKQTRSVYVSDLTGFQAGRTDTVRSFNCRLGTKVLKRIDVALLYQASSNSTDAIGFGFGGKQYGFEVLVRF